MKNKKEKWNNIFNSIGIGLITIHFFIILYLIPSFQFKIILVILIELLILMILILTGDLIKIIYTQIEKIKK